jgi:branched-chain amino acid transport system ATP-binding protein
MIGLVVLVNLNLANSRFGRAWTAIREDEVAARSMGIPLLPTKLIAFMTGAAFSGAMGVIYAAQRTFVSPESFTLLASITILAMVILGGMGSIPGAILGAAALSILNLDVLKTFSEFVRTSLPQIPSQVDPAKYERLVLGIRPGAHDDLPAHGPHPGKAPPGGDGGGSMKALEVQQVTKRFGGLVAVNEVSLEVNQGEIFSIIGPNGAGKTTFFNLLTGIYAPDEGRIRLFGKDVTGFSPDRIAKEGVGRTFQNIRLFGAMTVLENILVGMHIHIRVPYFHALLRTPLARREERRAKEEAERLLDYVGLLHRKDELARNLPYGEQRRLEIARALALKPRLLLLDEPAAGMNPRETEELQRLHRAAKRGARHHHRPH